MATLVALVSLTACTNREGAPSARSGKNELTVGLLNSIQGSVEVQRGASSLTLSPESIGAEIFSGDSFRFDEGESLVVVFNNTRSRTFGRDSRVGVVDAPSDSTRAAANRLMELAGRRRTSGDGIVVWPAGNLPLSRQWASVHWSPGLEGEVSVEFRTSNSGEVIYYETIPAQVGVHSSPNMHEELAALDGAVTVTLTHLETADFSRVEAPLLTRDKEQLLEEQLNHWKDAPEPARSLHRGFSFEEASQWPAALQSYEEALMHAPRSRPIKEKIKDAKLAFLPR